MEYTLRIMNEDGYMKLVEFKDGASVAKYLCSLDIQCWDVEPLIIHAKAIDMHCVLCSLRDEARKLWKYSEDEQEIAKGEWLRDLLYRKCDSRGVEI